MYITSCSVTLLHRNVGTSAKPYRTRPFCFFMKTIWDFHAFHTFHNSFHLCIPSILLRCSIAPSNLASGQKKNSNFICVHQYTFACCEADAFPQVRTPSHPQTGKFEEYDRELELSLYLHMDAPDGIWESMNQVNTTVS